MRAESRENNSVMLRWQQQWGMDGKQKRDDTNADIYFSDI
jgi:hypothetical protein